MTYLCLCVLVGLWARGVNPMSTTDPRWLVVPERRITLVRGEHLILTWRYRPPAASTRDTDTGFIRFSHHQPDNSYEDLLLTGNVHPVSGLITLDEVMYPDRISVISDYGSVQIDIVMTSHMDTGRYMLDMAFKGEETMHDLVDISVYQRPTWRHTPEEEMLVQPGSHVTMSWSISTNPHAPSVNSIKVISRGIHNQTNNLISAEINTATHEWTKEYFTVVPSEDISLDVHPRGTQIQLSLWTVSEEDTGIYTILVQYQDDVLQLQHTLGLYVTSGFGWRKSPQTDIYTLVSNDVTLEYIPNINIQVFGVIKLLLLRIEDSGSQDELVSLTYNTDGYRRLKRSGEESKHTTAMFDHNQAKTTFMLHRLRLNDSGSYQVKMYVAGQLVQRHNVSMSVITEDQLQPVFKLDDVTLDEPENTTSYGISPGQLVIVFPKGIPLPEMELFALWHGKTVVFVKGYNVSFLEVMVTKDMLAYDVITLGVYYEFHQQNYDFTMDVDAAGVAAASSANLIGVLVLIPCVVGLVILIVLLILRQHKQSKYKELPKVEMRSISGRSGVGTYSTKNGSLVLDTSIGSPTMTSVSTDRDEGYHSHTIPRQRESRYNRPNLVYRDPKPNFQGGKLSLVVEQDRQFMDPRSPPDHNDSFGKRRGSLTSDTSNLSKKSKSTYIIKSVYVKRESADKSDESPSPNQGKSYVSSPSLNTPYKNQNGGKSFTYPSQPNYNTSRPRSNLSSTYSKSQGTTLDDEVFVPNLTLTKPKSVSALPGNRGDYTIRPSTGDQMYTSVPAFLVKPRVYDTEEADDKDVINNNNNPVHPVSFTLPPNSREATV